MPDDFYIGYLPKAPDDLARFVRRTVIVVAFAAAAIAAALALAQLPFAASRFEYGEPRDFSGVLALSPYPHLATAAGVEWLAGKGKHGAVLPPGFDGARVTLRGTRIERGGERMIELEPDSLRVSEGAEGPGMTDLGDVTLHGEIVDAKCHLGVMSPGQGTVHRDCAARCLSGGLPAGLFVRGADGAEQMFWLTGVTRDFLVAHAGERVEVRGRLRRVASSLVVEARAVQPQ